MGAVSIVYIPWSMDVSQPFVHKVSFCKDPSLHAHTYINSLTHCGVQMLPQLCVLEQLSSQSSTWENYTSALCSYYTAYKFKAPLIYCISCIMMLLTQVSLHSVRLPLFSVQPSTHALNCADTEVYNYSLF